FEAHPLERRNARWPRPCRLAPVQSSAAWTRGNRWLESVSGVRQSAAQTARARARALSAVDRLAGIALAQARARACGCGGVGRRRVESDGGDPEHRLAARLRAQARARAQSRSRIDRGDRLA